MTMFPGEEVLRTWGAPMKTQTHGVPTETLLRSVSDPRRRAILEYLVDTGDDAIELDELPQPIVINASGGCTPRGHFELPSKVELHHTHLPALDEAGIIEYDPRGGTIRNRPSERMHKLLQFISTQLE